MRVKWYFVSQANRFACSLRLGTKVSVTSKDVARRAGVSQPTVSRALRDQRSVSASTRWRVRQAARELGYVPIQSGRALSTQTTGRVGIVSAELSNPFYPALIEPLHDILAELGYRTILVTDRGDAPIELEPLIDGSLDGVILTTSERLSSLPNELGRRGVPYVLINRQADGVDSDCCVANNIAGARAVADFLVALGHTKIGAIYGPDTTSTGHERAVGFRQRLSELGVSLPDRMVHEGPFAEVTGERGFTAIYPYRPTAIFCGNDVMALGVRNAAEVARVKVPDELTIVGFDDIPMASWKVFDLTTMRTDLTDLADHAVRLLVARMGDPERPFSRVVLEPKLILRGTHGPPRLDLESTTRL